MNPSIHKEYPYPIAKAYLRAVNADEPVDRFTQIGYLFEVTLKYAAAISISEYLAQPARDKNVNQTLSGIRRPSLGNWVGFLRDTLRFDLGQKKTILPDTYFKKSPELKNLATAMNKINEYLSPDKSSNLSSVSPEMFANLLVNYRNKTKGHGAMQKRDCIAINQLLFDAVEEFILSFDIFKTYKLAYITRIEFDKQGNFIYQLEKLEGTDILKTFYASPQPITDVYVTHICLCQPDGERIKPFLSLHPLFIFLDEKEDVYVLNEGETARIEYLCYHRGGRDAIYTPDELKEDFLAKFRDVLQTTEGVEKSVEVIERKPPPPPPKKEPEKVTRPSIVPPLEVIEQPKEVAGGPPAARTKKIVEVVEQLPPRRVPEIVEAELVSKAPAKRPSRAPLFVGIGSVVVIGIIISFFVLWKGEESQPTSAVQGTPSIAQQTQPSEQKPEQRLQENKLQTAAGETKSVTPKPEASKPQQPAIETQPTTPKTEEGEPQQPAIETQKQPEPETSNIYWDNPDVRATVIGGQEQVYKYIDYHNLQMEPGFKGTVQVRAYVNEGGGVDKAEIVQGIDTRFNSASINAVGKLRFNPAQRGGKPVKSKVYLSLLFESKEKKQPEKKEEEEVIPPPP